MYFYGFEFSIIELILLSVLLLVFVYQLIYYFRIVGAVIRRNGHIRRNKVIFSNPEVPQPVSVIICARDESVNLRKYLIFALEQDYPDFEVIVVNDGSNEETEDYLTQLKKQYPNLKSTFVPEGATNLSTKKLALTLGIKAAKSNWLLFTDADCMPEDKSWISKMARNFDPQAEFVLGYGAYFNHKGLLNKLITYDTLFNGLQFLGFASVGRPYMGVGRNMAYTKEVFLRQKGFASSLHLSAGDDDLMVNHAATKQNTRIETSNESVTWSEPKTSLKAWYFQKERHLSVSTFYKSISKFRLTFEPVTRGLFYATVIALLLLGNLITICATAGVFLIRFLVQLVIVNKSARHFGDRRYHLNLIFFDILLPLINLYILSFGRMGSKAKNIQWK